MKAFSLIVLILLLAACSTFHSSTQDVQQFYSAWMKLCSLEQDTSPAASALMQRYVARDVIARLKLINTFYEQQIVESDYFMYTQDCPPEGKSTFHTGTVSAFLGGEKVDVWLGDSDNRDIHLIVYTRREDNQWKIYRVRDLTHPFEHPIYSAGALTHARVWSAEIAPEYENQ